METPQLKWSKNDSVTLFLCSTIQCGVHTSLGAWQHLPEVGQLEGNLNKSVRTETALLNGRLSEASHGKRFHVDSVNQPEVKWKNNETQPHQAIWSDETQPHQAIWSDETQPHLAIWSNLEIEIKCITLSTCKGKQMKVVKGWTSHIELILPRRHCHMVKSTWAYLLSWTNN